MFFIRELAYICPTLHHDLLRQRSADTVHGGQVHLADGLQVLADLHFLRCILATRLALVRRQGSLVVKIAAASLTLPFVFPFDILIISCYNFTLYGLFPVKSNAFSNGNA